MTQSKKYLKEPFSLWIILLLGLMAGSPGANRDENVGYKPTPWPPWAEMWGWLNTGEKMKISRVYRPLWTPWTTLHCICPHISVVHWSRKVTETTALWGHSHLGKEVQTEPELAGICANVVIVCLRLFLFFFHVAVKPCQLFVSASSLRAKSRTKCL